MTPKQDKVLQALRIETRPDGEMCCTFRSIADAAEMKDVREVRRVVRQLARKGLAEYHKGLTDLDGEFRGAGYCISRKGAEMFGE